MRKPVVHIDRQKVLDSDGQRCRYCGHPLTIQTMQVDHIIPVSQGGTDDAFNLAASCPSCNTQKRGRTPEEWKGQFKWADETGFTDELTDWLASHKRPTPDELVQVVYETEVETDDEFDTILADRIFRDIQKQRGIRF